MADAPKPFPILAATGALLGAAALAGVLYLTQDRDAGAPVKGAFDSHESRLLALERDAAARADVHASGGAAHASGAREAAAPKGDAERVKGIEERLVALEAATAAMQKSLESLARREGVPLLELPAAGASAAQLKAVARKLEALTRTDADEGLRNQLIALRERLLAEYPNDPDAIQTFEALVQDYLRNRQSKDARRAIADRGDRLSLPEWKRERLTAHTYAVERDFANERQAYERIVGNPAAPVNDRADAEFWIAYTYYAEGKSEEAKAGFQTLVDKYGSSDSIALKQTVDGAKTHLVKIADAKKK
jgi:hypothetical protein